MKEIYRETDFLTVASIRLVTKQKKTSFARYLLEKIVYLIIANVSVLLPKNVFS